MLLLNLLYRSFSVKAWPKSKRESGIFVPFPREWNKMVGYCCTSSPHTLCSLSHEDQKELEKSIFFHVYCNHRTVWVGRGPYRPSSPGMDKLGHPHWVLVAWSSLTLNVHCCSGHPVPPPHHPYCEKKSLKKKKIIPYIQIQSLYFDTISPCPIRTFYRERY